jgi:hypothetical protein
MSFGLHLSRWITLDNTEGVSSRDICFSAWNYSYHYLKGCKLFFNTDIIAVISGYTIILSICIGFITHPVLFVFVLCILCCQFLWSVTKYLRRVPLIKQDKHANPSEESILTPDVLPERRREHDVYKLWALAYTWFRLLQHVRMRYSS